MTILVVVHLDQLEPAQVTKVLQAIPEGHRGRLVFSYDAGDATAPWLQLLDRYQPEVEDPAWTDPSEPAN